MAKKSEQLMVRVTEEVMADLVEIEKVTGIKAADVARLGLVEVMRRLKAGAPAIEPELAQMVERAREHGVDLIGVLEGAIAKHGQPAEAIAS